MMRILDRSSLEVYSDDRSLFGFIVDRIPLQGVIQ